MIALPLVLMFVFGFVMGDEDSGIMLPIADLDETEQSAILVEELENLGAYNIKLMDEEGLRQMVMENGAEAGLIIPRGFGERIIKGEPHGLTFLLPGKPRLVIRCRGYLPPRCKGLPTIPPLWTGRWRRWIGS